MAEPFQHAILRVVPRIERGERLNVGVVVFCRTRSFLAARTHLDVVRLAALAPGTDPTPIAGQLAWVERVAAGELTAGPLAALSPSERFGWIVAPASTVLQPSRTHTGLCEDPGATLDALLKRLVLVDGVV